MKSNKLFTSLILIFGTVLISNAQLAEKATDISPLLIGETIPDINLSNIDSESVSILSLLDGKPSILLFYRGGWCPYCNRHLSEIATVEDRIIEMGFNLMAISPDSPSKLKESVGKNSLKYTLLSDSKGDFSKGMGIAFKASERSMDRLSDYSDGKNEGYLPVPGLFVVDADGVILFEYINPNYKNRISAGYLMAILEHLAAGN